MDGTILIRLELYYFVGNIIIKITHGHAGIKYLMNGTYIITLI